MSAHLDALAKLLRRRPLTAREIAAATHVSKPTAYARIEALRELGVQVFEVRLRRTHPGPAPVAFGVRP